jgi:hypothetical protein
LASLVARSNARIVLRTLLSDYVFRRLAPASEQAQAAEAGRAADVWLLIGRERAELNDLGSNANAVDLYLEDMRAAGEREAVRRQFDRAGISPAPPAQILQDPEFAERLLLPEQRQAAR